MTFSRGQQTSLRDSFHQLCSLHVGVLPHGHLPPLAALTSGHFSSSKNDPLFSVPSSHVPWLYGHPRLVFRDLRYAGCLGFPYYTSLFHWSSYCRGGGDSQRPLLPHCAPSHGKSLLVGTLSPSALCWSLSNFVYCILLCSLNAIGIGYLMSMPLVFDLTFTMEGGEGERALLQHRQLHRIFRLFCALLYTLLCCVYPSMPLNVSLDCSVDGVCPPSGAIRNRRPIL